MWVRFGDSLRSVILGFGSFGLEGCRFVERFGGFLVFGNSEALKGLIRAGAEIPRGLQGAGVRKLCIGIGVQME